MISILYVEDNPLNLRLVQRYLKSENIRVIEAATGTIGMEKVITERPDLILLDMNLPDIDGLEISRKLRADSVTASIPIIALTANTMMGDRELCLEAGCDAYLAKPVTKIELRNAVRIALAKKEI